MAPSEPAAVVSHVGKCYHVYDRNLDRLRQSFVLGPRKLYREFWALRDISFTVDRGETVGIVGSNGSGKSTLLQLMFGVLSPTSGTVRINGKVNGLLELGAGFNPEETGRQNVLINAAILGVPPGQVPDLVKQVAEFADIGDFIDQPIKVYSSGMAVRLGFALQICIPCDVLIVDEALAVGDELFQRKCFGALERFRAGGGTVLFVSHAAAMVTQLCKRAVFLDHGELVRVGPARDVVNDYQKFLYMPEPHRSEYRAELIRATRAGEVAKPIVSEAASPAYRPATADFDASDDVEPGLVPQSTTSYASQGVRILNPRVEALDGRTVNVLRAGRRYRFCYDAAFDKDCGNVLYGCVLKSTSGLELGGTAHAAPTDAVPHVAAGRTAAVSFAFTAALLPGVYYFNCGVTGFADGHQGFLARVVDVVAVRVKSENRRQVTGFVDFGFEPTVTVDDDAEPDHAEPAVSSVA